MSYRVALASDDGINVNVHFGFARYYTVVDIDGDGYKEVERRIVQSEYFDRGCGECGGGNPAADVAIDQKFGAVINTLSDCKAIFASRFGRGAVSYLLRNNIRLFQVLGPIDEILRYTAREKLLEKEDGV